VARLAAIEFVNVVHFDNTELYEKPAGVRIHNSYFTVVVFGNSRASGAVTAA
jgi:hypothetical protein